MNAENVNKRKRKADNQPRNLRIFHFRGNAEDRKNEYERKDSLDLERFDLFTVEQSVRTKALGGVFSAAVNAIKYAGARNSA